MAGDPILEAALAERAKRQAAGQWAPKADPVSDEKVAQHEKTSAFRARMMRQGENEYQGALDKGYNPRSAWNAAADWVGGGHVPFIGKHVTGLAPVMRGPAADQAQRGKDLFTEGFSKEATGLTAPQKEAEKHERIPFPAYGEDDEAARGAERTRRELYSAANQGAGSRADKRPYVDFSPVQRQEAARYAGSKGKFGGATNPMFPRSQLEYDNMPPGSYYVPRKGGLRQKPAK